MANPEAESFKSDATRVGTAAPSWEQRESGGAWYGLHKVKETIDNHPYLAITAVSAATFGIDVFCGKLRKVFGAAEEVEEALPGLVLSDLAKSKSQYELTSAALEKNSGLAAHAIADTDAAAASAASAAKISTERSPFVTLGGNISEQELATLYAKNGLTPPTARLVKIDGEHFNAGDMENLLDPDLISPFDGATVSGRSSWGAAVINWSGKAKRATFKALSGDKSGF